MIKMEIKYPAKICQLNKIIFMLKNKGQNEKIQKFKSAPQFIYIPIIKINFPPFFSRKNKNKKVIKLLNIEC